MVLQLPYLNSTSKRQFIPAEGIDMDILKAYLSLPRFGGKVDLRPAVNFEDVCSLAPFYFLLSFFLSSPLSYVL